MQPTIDNSIGGRVIQVRCQLTHQLFRTILKVPNGRPRNGVQRLIGATNTVMHGTRKITIHHQKIHHFPRRNAPIFLPVHLKATHRFQHCRPMNIVNWRAHILWRWQQHEVFDVKNARRLIGPFQLPSQSQKMPRFVVSHGGISHTLKQMGSQPDFSKGIQQPFWFRHCILRLNLQIHAVHLGPHFRRNSFPHRPCIFTRKS